MPNLLRVGKLTAVGLVDSGANQNADILIWKRAPDGRVGPGGASGNGFRGRRDSESGPQSLGKADSFSEIQGRRRAQDDIWRFTSDLGQAFQSVLDDEDETDKQAALTGSLAEFQAAVESAIPNWLMGEPAEKSNDRSKSIMEKLPTLAAVLKALGFSKDDVSSLKPEDIAAGLDDKPAEKTEPVADPIVAKAIEDMQKRLGDAEKRASDAEALAKRLDDEKQNRTYVEKASNLRHLPGVTADDFGPVLRKVAGALDEDTFAKFEQTLKAANEAIHTGSLFKEIGSGSGVASGVMAEVAGLVTEIRKANPSLDEHGARAQVWKSRPDLLTAYERERQQALRAAGITTEE